MLIDSAIVTLKGGHGGAGKVSFYPGLKSGPDGGNGGKGGDVYIKTTSDLSALRKFTTKRFLQAQNGEEGERNRKFGKDGQDLEILVPVGSVLESLDNKEEIELNEVGLRLMVCKGGLGGRGNFEFKSSRNTTPKYAQPGLDGEEKHFRINLKLIAEYGLIGLPNAGKSSLLNELTAADAKVANYPFTTLEPNLGVLNQKVIADIPGLIEGASRGKGLGIKFLKHIEKVKLLIHCISSESDDLRKDYQTIRKELGDYNKELLEKKEIILLTKSDLIKKKKIEENLKKLHKISKNSIAVSIHDYDSLEEFKKLLSRI